MKKNLLLVVAVLCIVIFASTMPYEQQSIIPQIKNVLKHEPFKETLSDIEIVYWGKSISIETKGYAHFIEFLIRKGTHFIGYGIVGLIFYSFYRKLRWKFAPSLGIGTVFLLGSFDEFRQFYTPGRTGMFGDVLLDTSGAIFFISIALIIKIVIAKIKGGRRATR